jgi:hypothetical protein
VVPSRVARVLQQQWIPACRAPAEQRIMGCVSSRQQEAKAAHSAFEVTDHDAYASVSEILQRSENKSMLSVVPSETSARWHTLPSSHFCLRYGCVSQRGQYPDVPKMENQDRWCVHVPYGGNAEQALFGVFDGHGDNGSQCAAFAALKVRGHAW